MKLIRPQLSDSLVKLYEERRLHCFINHERTRPEDGIKLSDALKLWLPGYEDSPVRYKIEARRTVKGGLILETYCPQRVAEALMRMMPGYPAETLHLHQGADLAKEDTYLVCVHRYDTTPDGESTWMYRFGSYEDVQQVLRGMIHFKIKQNLRLMKQHTQLIAYHGYQLAKQEKNQLRRGHWLGAEKALMTAARVPEPSIPFMGDVTLTPEQRQPLLYWAVPEQMGMSAAFPAGTGLAMKKVTSGKQLVEGVYLYRATLGHPGDAYYHVMQTLGRLDLSRKKRGFFPLYHDENPEKEMLCWAQWKNDPAKDWEITLYRVVAYTTHAPEVVAQRSYQQAEVQSVFQHHGQESLAVAA